MLCPTVSPWRLPPRRSHSAELLMVGAYAQRIRRMLLGIWGERLNDRRSPDFAPSTVLLGARNVPYRILYTHTLD
jgi:hypothetical protein